MCYRCLDVTTVILVPAALRRGSWFMCARHMLQEVAKPLVCAALRTKEEIHSWLGPHTACPCRRTMVSQIYNQ